MTDETAAEPQEDYVELTPEESKEYKGPAHTSHRNYAVDVDDKAANMVLVFTGLLQTVDELKREETRAVGLEMLRTIATETKSVKLKVVEGGKAGLR